MSEGVHGGRTSGMHCRARKRQTPTTATKTKKTSAVAKRGHVVTNHPPLLQHVELVGDKKSSVADHAQAKR